MIGGMIIEKERKDFSKVQIYIQDLDLCDKLNDDFYNVGCANKSEYASFLGVIICCLTFSYKMASRNKREL